MERLFIDSEAPEMIPYDLSGKYLLYPVRHHSPACSYHLIKTIEAYEPDIILIEGPENACELIPSLTDELTKLPAALYYYYKDTKKLLSEDAEDYKCYYPFLKSSPEYNAMAKGKEKGIPVRFIDLPYYEIILNTDAEKGMRKEADRHSYADESRITQSRFYAKICEKTGLRSFEEFWEKNFEIKGLRMETKEFVRLLHTYCILTRKGTPEEDMAADATLAREQYMAHNIAEAMKEYGKVLVVTGGFHSYGIWQLLEKGGIKPPKIHRIADKSQGCYPMAYSYEAADSLNGYASGMECPQFYDTVMEQLLEKDSPENIYNDVTLDLLVKTAKDSAKKDIAVSIADITSARTLMNGLAALRDCPECGLFELRDGVTSAFIKGEKTLSSSLPLDILRRLAAGNKTGYIGDKKHIPPLIADFEEQCRKFGMKTLTSAPKDIDVPLFTTQKGMETSRFLHRMDFLGTDFAVMKKGPDLKNNKERSRVREEWKYRRSPAVDAALIDKTTDGSTIMEACLTAASRMLRQERRCEVAAGIAVDCFLMGIQLGSEEMTLIDDILSTDGDAFSIGKALRRFETLCSLRQLYGFDDGSAMIYVRQCFGKLLTLLPSLASVPSDRAKECTDILSVMYGITGDLLSDQRENFMESLVSMSNAKDKEPTVYGAVTGLLYAMDSSYRDYAARAMKGYLTGTLDIKKQGADFLSGLFSTARDIIFADESFMEMIDQLITEMGYSDFIEILPSMRLAFSYFTPAEVQDTAKAAAALHGKEKKDILSEKAIDEDLYVYGTQLDIQVLTALGKEALLA